jgi:hypothetical protein
MASINKGDRFRTNDSNQTYEVVGRWYDNLVLAPTGPETDECLIYAAEEIEKMVNHRKWARIGGCDV